MKDNYNAVFEQEYRISTFNINTNKYLGLYGLLGFIEDIASEHALRLGFGYQDMIDNGVFWVLVRQKLRMDKWPKWHDSLKIQTWTRPTEGLYFIREFEFFMGDEKVGDCSTTFMVLDLKSRRPKEIDPEDFKFTPRSDYTVGYLPDRIDVPENMALAQNFRVRISDLDMNRHVNNTKYARWALDAIPFKYHSSHAVHGFEINFLGETLLDDEISIYSDIAKDQNSGAIHFVGKKQETDKMMFVMRMDVSAL
jgi:acyl-ACP thioesterase